MTKGHAAIHGTAADLGDKKSLRQALLTAAWHSGQGELGRRPELPAAGRGRDLRRLQPLVCGSHRSCYPANGARLGPAFDAAGQQD